MNSNLVLLGLLLILSSNNTISYTQVFLLLALYGTSNGCCYNGNNNLTNQNAPRTV